MKCKMLLFDLDGTLLQTDKSISKATRYELEKCKNQGIMIGVSTSRSEKNSLEFISELNPDVVISSAGALVKYKDKYVYKAEFTQTETKDLLKKAREICGKGCEITIDTVDEHYWNYRIDPKQQDKSWGDSVYTDFKDFEHASLKMCVEIFDEKAAEQLQKNLPECDCVHFSDGYWYKFTKKTATKEKAILHLCNVCGIATDDIVAFGDDFADIGMLKLCGVGVAMGNAIDEVKAIADCVIGDNDHDGIANYLESVVFERKYEYKKATVEDIDELVRTRIIVLRAANKLSNDADMSVVEQESYAYYKKALASEEHIAYLVYAEGKFIGAGGVSFYQVMPTCHNPSGKKAYIMNMYTAPNYRRQGVAFHTLDLLVRDAREKGVSQIMLEATDMGRPLYEKYGFVKMEDEMELE